MSEMIKGKNIILREPRNGDIIRRAELGNNKEFLRMTGVVINQQGLFNIADADSWYKRVLEHPCKWIIDYNHKMIGTVSLRVNDRDHKAKLAIEIYDETLYGKGLGSEVIKLVLDYGFNKLNLNKIYLRVLEYNKRGINCYKKCGFVIEGYDREGSLINNEYHTDVYMSILKSEYKGF